MQIELRQSLLSLQEGRLQPPSGDALQEVAELETRYAIALPSDFRDYLLEGSSVSGWNDPFGLGWYSIHHLKRLTDFGDLAPPETPAQVEISREANSYLVFADYLDWCGYGYAICCSGGTNRGRVAMVCPDPYRFIATSFSNFVALAAADSDRLHSPAGDQHADII